MEFRILGSVEVVDDGRPIAIRRGKELALLAYLLLHANEVIPSERLIDELWGEMSPSTAPKILQNAVSHLRRALGEDRIATRGPGYVLRVEDGELDVKEFDRLAREGKPEAALGLWRGTPLLELRAERFADDARRQLDERRVAILEDRIDADLAAGRDAEVVAELKELIAEHPLRERLHGQLMTALYRAGRQGEALEAYQRARKTLSSELGLDPGPELQELERKILKQDPAIAAPPAKRPARRPAAPPIPRRFALLGILGVLLIAAAVGVGLTLSHGDKHLIVRPNSLVVIDPNGNRIVGVVPVGNTPRGVAVGTKAVWVTNSADGTVSEVDPKQLKVTQTIGIGARATDAVVAAGRVWIATGSDNSLVQIDERAGGVVGRLSLSPDPSASAHAVAATSDAIWVASGDLLYKIDPASGNVVAHSHEHVGTGNSCCFGINDVAVGFGAAWVADISELVVRLSSASVRETGSAQLGVIPPAIAVGEGGVWLALPDPVAQRVALWRVDPLTVRITETITLGKGLGYPPTLELAVGGGAIWVSNFDAGTLVRVDPKLGVVTDTIRIGHHPFGVAFGANRVWVTVS